MAEEETLPEHLQCKRTDGRTWRCKRRVMENMKLCEIHYLQGRHRQYREKVPDSLKLQRKSKKVAKSDPVSPSVEIRAPKAGTMAKLMKRRRSAVITEALDETLKKMKSKRGNMQLELIRMFLKREVEKMKKKELDNTGNKMKKKKLRIEQEENLGRELMRELPNGRMAISPAPSPHHSDNAGPSCDVKVGVELDAIPRRRFRSKNIEPLPIGALQVVPYGHNVGKIRKGRRKKCHWCKKSGTGSLTLCSSCQREFFCVDCIRERYFDTQDEIKKACPVCRGTCNCKDCSENKPMDTESKDKMGDNNEADRILCYHYLIFMLLPVLKKINKEKKAEIEREALIKGKEQSEVHIKEAEYDSNVQQFCNYCKASIVDLYRSCSGCSYNVCLSCCRDFSEASSSGSVDMPISKFRNGRKTRILGAKQLSKNKNSRNSKQTSCGEWFRSSILTKHGDHNGIDGLSCPSIKYGGCGDSLLDLRCVFPFSWTEELEVKAEEIVCSYDFPEPLDMSSRCSLCLGIDTETDRVEQFQEASLRKDSDDNYIYYPRLLDVHHDKLEHFQRHWGKGHPVIIRHVLQNADLSWDPIVMFCTYLERIIAKFANNLDLVSGSTCLDWCEVEIGVRQYFLGSLKGRTRTNTWNEMLKLKGWLSSHLFQEQLPVHYAEVMQSLPLQEYTNPTSGLLNLAAKLPHEAAKIDIGPSVYISYGCAEERLCPGSVSGLCYDSYDVVNILAHSTDVPVSTEQLSKIMRLLQKQKAQSDPNTISADQKTEDEAGEESSLPKVKMEKTGSKDNMIDDDMHFSKRFPRKCCFSAAASDVTTRGPKDNNIVSHVGKRGLDFDCLAPSSTTMEDQTYRDKIESSKCNGDEISADSCTAQWDIFRRQDVPKLAEYLKRHSGELTHMNDFDEHVVHPILDQSFFLDTAHKMKLKEEFEIEPWTFVQHVGEAVIIPAGCAYQIMNPKSCVHVVVGFVSPENAAQSIELIDEARLLPDGHRAKVDKLEVKKMALDAITAAIKDIRDITSKLQAPH